MTGEYAKHGKHVGRGMTGERSEPTVELSEEHRPFKELFSTDRVNGEIQTVAEPMGGRRKLGETVWKQWPFKGIMFFTLFFFVQLVRSGIWFHSDLSISVVWIGSPGEEGLGP